MKAMRISKDVCYCGWGKEGKARERLNLSMGMRRDGSMEGRREDMPAADCLLDMGESRTDGRRPTPELPTGESKTEGRRLAMVVVRGEMVVVGKKAADEGGAAAQARWSAARARHRHAPTACVALPVSRVHICA